jgi:hypothetical protein
MRSDPGDFGLRSSEIPWRIQRTAPRKYSKYATPSMSIFDEDESLRTWYTSYDCFTPITWFESVTSPLIVPDGDPWWPCLIIINDHHPCNLQLVRFRILVTSTRTADLRRSYRTSGGNPTFPESAAIKHLTTSSVSALLHRNSGPGK